MDAQRRELEQLLAIHAHSAVPTAVPTAYLHFRSADGTLPTRGALVALTRDDILDALDPSSELVCWLLEQMRTYTCHRQRIVGLVFDRRTVLSEVLRMPTSE